MMIPKHKWSVLLLVLIFYCIGLAQSDEFGVQAISGPRSILLLIGGEMLHPSTAGQHDGWTGYNIYRKEKGKSKFDKINSQPISRVGTIDEFEKKLGIKTEMAIKFLGIQNQYELWQLIEQDDERINVISILDLAYREALGLSYLDTKVKSGKNYVYTIARVNKDGKESAKSNESEVTFGVPPFTLKGPLNLTGEADDKEVRLEWQPNPADSGVFSYSIYRSTSRDGYYTKINNKPIMIFYQEDQDKPSPGLFTDSKVKTGVDYYYTVVSVDIAGNESMKDNIITLTPRDDRAPRIPQNVKAQSSDLGITITWDNSTEPDLAGYNIYRSPYADSQFVRVNKMLSPPDTGFYNDITARPNTQYYYRIAALDRSGNESKQSARVFTLFENKLAPLPPQVVKAVGTKDGVTITWSAGEETDIQGYYVFRSESHDDPPVQISPLISKEITVYYDTDKFLSPKGNYWYYVRAINYSGYSSAYSAPATATPNINIAPEPPLTFYGYQDIKGNRLFWDLPFDNTVAGYNIYRAIEADSLVWEKITEMPVYRKTRTYTDTTSKVGVTYVYRIKSANDKGLESAPSHRITLNMFTPPPFPPGNVMVTPAKDGLKISWDISMESDAAGYYIYRRIPGKKIEKISDMMLAVAQSTYIDKSAAKGQRYYYSVSCVDTQGREGQRSDEQDYILR